MRTLEDIKKDVDALMPAYEEISEKLYALRQEERRVIFSGYCDKYGIKLGDIVEIENHHPCVVVGIGSIVFQWIMVKGLNEDGTLKKTSFPIDEHQFKNCKVVGHMDVEFE